MSRPSVQRFEDRAAFERLSYDFADREDAESLSFQSVSEFVDHECSNWFGPDGVPADAELSVYLWRFVDYFDEMARIAGDEAERTAEYLEERLAEDGYANPEESDPELLHELKISAEAALCSVLRRHSWMCEPFAVYTYERDELVAMLRDQCAWEPEHLRARRG